MSWIDLCAQRRSGSTADAATLSSYHVALSMLRNGLACGLTSEGCLVKRTDVVSTPKKEQPEEWPKKSPENLVPTSTTSDIAGPDTGNMRSKPSPICNQQLPIYLPTEGSRRLSCQL